MNNTFLLFILGFCFGYMFGCAEERKIHKYFYNKGYEDGMKAEAFHRVLCEEEKEE